MSLYSNTHPYTAPPGGSRYRDESFPAPNTVRGCVVWGDVGCGGQDAVERARVAEEELANKEKEILREQKRASRNNTQTDSLSHELQA